MPGLVHRFFGRACNGPVPIEYCQPYPEPWLGSINYEENPASPSCCCCCCCCLEGVMHRISFRHGHVSLDFVVVVACCCLRCCASDHCETFSCSSF